MPVGVGVVAGGDLVAVACCAISDAIAYGDEQSIRILPSQSSVMKPPGRVDVRVHHGQVEPVPVGDLAPVGDAGAAERVGADAHAGVADRVQVEHDRQVGDVGVEEVVRAGGRRRRGPARTGSGARRSARRRAARWPGPGSSRVASVSAGPPLRRVVLEAAVGGRVVRRGDHDAVGQPGACGPGCGRGSRATAPGSGCSRRRLSTSTRHAVGGEHLQRGDAWPARTARGCPRPRNSGPSVPCACAGTRRSPGWWRRCGPR